ncbi:Dynein light chain roadblock-type 2 [Vanrija pseudolonga]|uniref:Dynein light chain roadblock-type 2 n=1 Tax=Vanrija pseudolonga TaxID=143232 RepID=A0AAF0YJU7_9TREE|nr:Dynein light chain roadblock-type 2 [Vanrija pseudolonga]
MASPDPIANGVRPRAPPSSPPLSSTAPRAPPPPEIESTLSRLSAYRNVRGVMVLARSSGAPGSGGIVQSTGAVFEGESGRRYAGSLEAVVNATAGAVATVDEGDELKLMRIRTKRHELIITPDDRYLLVVLQDPGQ